MTTLLTKRVKRLSDESVSEGRKIRRLVVTLYPGGTIGLRPEGCKREYSLPIRLAYTLAIRLENDRKKEEKRKARGGPYLARRGKL